MLGCLARQCEEGDDAIGRRLQARHPSRPDELQAETARAQVGPRAPKCQWGRPEGQRLPPAHPQVPHREFFQKWQQGQAGGPGPSVHPPRQEGGAVPPHPPTVLCGCSCACFGA